MPTQTLTIADLGPFDLRVLSALGDDRSDLLDAYNCPRTLIVDRVTAQLKEDDTDELALRETVYGCIKLIANLPKDLR
jgi:hypothetical protein